MNVRCPQPDGGVQKRIGLCRSPMGTNQLKCSRGLLRADIAEIHRLILTAAIIHKPIPRLDAALAYAQLYNNNRRLSNG